MMKATHFWGSVDIAIVQHDLHFMTYAILQGAQSCMCDTEHMFSCPDSAMNMFNKQQVNHFMINEEEIRPPS
jgi:Neuroendocrine protein 7B2 precursor (Secretogranin V)